MEKYNNEDEIKASQINNAEGVHHHKILDFASFIHLFNTHCLSGYYLLSTLLGARAPQGRTVSVLQDLTD